MLVLLAIVLTTATFVAQGKIPVTLPKASEAQPATASAVELTVSGCGILFIVDGQDVTLDDLTQRLAQLHKDTLMLLRIDEGPVPALRCDHRSAQNRAVEECVHRHQSAGWLMSNCRWIGVRVLRPVSPLAVIAAVSPSPGRRPVQSAQNDRIMPISLDMFELPVKPKR